MNSDSRPRMHQPETEFIGALLTFSGPALSPSDPSIEPRDRKGRPTNGKPVGDNAQEDQRQVE